MAGRKSDFTLTKLDDLFSTQEQRDEEKLSKIRDIPLELIDDFPDHPFKVRDDEDMMQLVESVKERGVITPARVPKHAHGTTNLKRQTSSTMLITDAVMELYDRIVDKNLLIRRINITANRLVDENSAKKEDKYEQLDLFTDYKAKEQEQVKEEAALEREKRMQQTMLTIKKKFGKNAILKGMNLQEGATAKDRNEQIGGHKA